MHFSHNAQAWFIHTEKLGWAGGTHAKQMEKKKQTPGQYVSGGVNQQEKYHQREHKKTLTAIGVLITTEIYYRISEV